MSSPKRSQALVLAIHPTPKGFGWVLFEGALAPVDWGIASAKSKRRSRSLARFERLMSRYEPSVVIFEEFEKRVPRRGDRIQHLCRAMIHLASCRGAETTVYNRATIRTCFASVGATTREQIAQAIALHIPEFRPRLPRKRKPWESEPDGQCLFDAAALALTYFAINGRLG